MADLVVTNNPVSVIVTTYSNLGTLPPKDGQMILVKDKGMSVFDYDGKRTFYHDIEIINSEANRKAMLAPIDKKFYFVLDTAILWVYIDNAWKQLTHNPEEILYIGITLPEIGEVGRLYVDRSNKRMAVWNDTTNKYEDVANYSGTATESDIIALFE